MTWLHLLCQTLIYFKQAQSVSFCQFARANDYWTHIDTGRLWQSKNGVRVREWENNWISIFKRTAMCHARASTHTQKKSHNLLNRNGKDSSTQSASDRPSESKRERARKEGTNKRKKKLEHTAPREYKYYAKQRLFRGI